MKVRDLFEQTDDVSKWSNDELETFIKKHWGGGVPTFGKGAMVKRAMQELKKREMKEDHTANFPKKITLQDARHSLEYRENNFKKRGLGPLLKIVPEVIAALPPRSMIEVTWGGDSTDFFYHSGEAWFDAAGKKTDPVRIAKHLKELNDQDEPHEFRATGWVLKA